MNKLGFGFLRLPYAGEEIDYAELNKMVDSYLAGGGRYFDTAYTYLDGLSEEAICKALVQRHPRESFLLASKLPGYYAKSYADCFRYFEESANRCGVDYFDMYMLHWLDSNHYPIARQQHQFEFLSELKRTGKARKIGFSFHDTPELLDEILTYHPEVDCVLLQINYLDWESPAIQSRLCYETALRHGKSVIAMEPVKGGKLASVPQAAAEVLQKIDPTLHPASHAIRFVKNLPGVDIVLSGMNSMTQLEDNLKDRPPMSVDELDLLRQAAELIRKSTAIACTGCGYCLPACPMQIPIPDCFSLYNEYRIYPRHQWKIIPAYKRLPVNATACVECQSCEAHCPQKLPISQHMQAVIAALES